MQNPTFHLDSVVKSKGGLDDFDGPLNLILMLLSKNKIEIRDIQISLILDQYLEFIRGMQELDLEVASEFVQMASHLTYIKTRMLLSGGEDVSELEQLMDSLEQLKCKDAYLKIKEVIPQFSKATEKGLMMFSAPGEPQPKYGEYNIQHEPSELFRALAEVLTRGGRGAIEEPLAPFVPQRIVYGVREKSREIIDYLRGHGEVTAGELYGACRSRSELVAAFVSLLELCSGGTVTLTAIDGDYLVTFTGVVADGLFENIPE